MNGIESAFHTFTFQGGRYSSNVSKSVYDDYRPVGPVWFHLNRQKALSFSHSEPCFPRIDASNSCVLRWGLLRPALSSMISRRESFFAHSLINFLSFALFKAGCSLVTHSLRFGSLYSV